MGCIWNKIPGKTDDIHTCTLTRAKSIEIEVLHGNTIKKTPSAYLIENSIQYNTLPPFVLHFYISVQKDLFFKVSQNVYKDLYYIGNHVISCERVNLVNYNDRCALFETIKRMKHRDNILIPTHHFYHPLTQKTGICIQRLPFCKHGDMFDFMVKGAGTKNVDVNEFVRSMSTTLQELHENNIFLTDIKLENILYSNRFQYADIEYAFINKPFVDSQASTEDKLNNIYNFKKGGRRWIRTLQYIPEKTFPSTIDIAVRNDVFALARCIGMLISVNVFDMSIKMFQGDEDFEIHDQRHVLREHHPNVWEHAYIKECAACICEYDKYANAKFLETLMEIYYNNNL